MNNTRTQDKPISLKPEDMIERRRQSLKKTLSFGWNAALRDLKQIESLEENERVRRIIQELEIKI